MQENLNDYFPNPFEYLEGELLPPFEVVKNHADIGWLETNIVIDYHIFCERVRFNPFLDYEEMVRNNEKVLYLTMFVNLPQYELTFNRTKEYESKGSYNVKKYYPYLNFELQLIPRSKFTDEHIRDKYLGWENIFKELPKSQYVVNIVYPKIVKFQIKFNFAKKNEEELQVLKTGLQQISDYYMKLLGNSELYPLWVKREDYYVLEYPDKEEAYLIDSVIEGLQ